MQETPQQYIQRILGQLDGKDPLRVQAETPKKQQKLIKPLTRQQMSRRPEPGVGITRIHGVAGELPKDPTRNTAGQALLAMQESAAHTSPQ